MLRALYDWVLSWSDAPSAGAALFLLAFAESSFFPIPPDVLLIAMTLGQPQQGMVFAGITTVGSVLGGLFGYLIGWLGGRPLLRRWIGQERMDKVHTLFQRYEAWAILLAAFTPIPYKVFTIAAGAFYVSIRTFVLASIVGRGGRFFLVAGTLQLLGPWMKELIERYFDLFSVLFLVLLIGGFVLLHRWQARHSRSSSV